MGIRCPECKTDNTSDSQFCKKCAAPLQPSDDIPISVTKTIVSPVLEGSTLAGKYRIIEKLGEGGMGVVYKAEDVRLERIVALKFLPSALTQNTKARKRFIQEAKAASSLDHPNICTIHEIDETEDGQVFIAMPCYEGESLKERILQGPLEQGEALDVAIQVAQGLDKAHKQGIVHRDIKPGNIMITQDEVAKIVDFGLAKLSGQVKLTRTGTAIGTLAYMSPEQARGEEVDHQTDVWSLGIMLYEMLTQHLPFGGEHEGSLVYAIVHAPPRSMRKLNPNIKPELDRVVEKALEKNPADRYQSMGELLEDLRALAEGMKPSRAKPSLFKGRVLGIKKVYFFAGLILIVALIALGTLMILPGRGEVLDSIAILPLVNDSGDPSQDYFANSLTDRLIAEFYKVSALRVVSRQAVMTYAKTTKSPQQIARELNVTAIVEASVLKSGNKVRLIARLIDPKRNNQIWGDTFEREYSDILFLQSDLAQAIVKGIKVGVLPEESALIASAHKVNPEAYDLVMQGIDQFISPLKPEMSLLDRSLTSLEYFQRAIDIDPTMALAHAWKAQIFVFQAYNQLEDLKEAVKKAKEAVQKALELDENLAIAHAVSASVKQYMDWDFTGAEKEYKKAIELEPGNEFHHNLYETFLAYMGRYDESIGLCKSRIGELEKAQSKKIYSQRLVDFYLCAGRYDEGLEEMINVVKSDPSQEWFNILWLAAAYATKGMYPEALTNIDKIKDQPGPQKEPFVLANHAWILALSGRSKEAMEKMEALKSLLAQRNINYDYFAAAIYGALGDKNKAFDYLYLAYESRWPLMVLLLSDFWFHNLHDDPRFDDLLKKVGFPDTSTSENR